MSFYIAVKGTAFLQGETYMTLEMGMENKLKAY